MNWILKQTWNHLLFMHWELDPEELSARIPPKLELDLFKGRAWVTVLPFKVTDQRFRWFPEIPLLNSYLELNVRTYVKYKGVPGVYFFSLDANHPLTVLCAKAVSLPYRNAKMNMCTEGSEVIFQSKRIFRKAEFSVVYKSVSSPAPAVSGSLDYWLLERYCLYTKWRNSLLRGDISHKRWEVSQAEVKVEANTIIPVKPQLLHYANRKDTLLFPFKKV